MGISFCIATYNRLKSITRLVESLRKGFEDYPNEIIVADGGSTDGTIKYLKSFGDIKIIEQNELSGSVKAFNEGFKIATQNYLFPLSDDLELVAPVIIKACNLMDKEPNIGLVAPKIQEPHYGNLTGVTLKTHSYWTLLPKTFVFRASVIKEMNYFDENYRTYFIDDDSPLCTLTLGYTIIYTKEVGVIHHREKDEESNIARAITLKKMKDGREINHFNKKWGDLRGKVASYRNPKSILFHKLCSIMFYSDWLRPAVEINNKVSMNLYDWLLQNTVAFNDEKYKGLEDFYLAQKYPNELISSLK